MVVSFTLLKKIVTLENNQTPMGHTYNSLVQSATHPLIIKTMFLALGVRIKEKKVPIHDVLADYAPQREINNKKNLLLLFQTTFVLGLMCTSSLLSHSHMFLARL